MSIFRGVQDFSHERSKRQEVVGQEWTKRTHEELLRVDKSPSVMAISQNALYSDNCVCILHELLEMKEADMK